MPPTRRLFRGCGVGVAAIGAVVGIDPACRAPLVASTLFPQRPGGVHDSFGPAAATANRQIPIPAVAA